MALEDKNEVPSTSNSSCDDCEYDYDDDDDESSIISKLLLKCKSLLSKKKHYKHELTSLSKEFENLKIFPNLLNQTKNLQVIWNVQVPWKANLRKLTMKILSFLRRSKN